MSRKMHAMRNFSVSACKSPDFDAPMQDIALEEEEIVKKKKKKND
jgi:hypothetical protein